MTSPDSSLRVAEEIERELYLGVTIDGSRGCPIVMVSLEGGVEIEETVWISFGENLHFARNENEVWNRNVRKVQYR